MSLSTRVAARYLMAKAYFDIGDVIYYGKYKNSKGVIVGFGRTDKGNPTAEVEPIPKGRKQNKIIQLFRFWHADLEKRGTTDRQACIVAAGVWDGSRCLMKTRDRNYKPRLKAFHKIRNGVEMLYVRDMGTGWIEGMNEFGIGIVNSALSVVRDETEKKVVRQVGKRSKDGRRIREALNKKTLDDAVESACNYEKGIKGHTFISDPDKTISIEQTSDHECVVKTVTGTKVHVRTNHGFHHEDAGYTNGEDYVSSVYRRDRAKKILREAEKPEDLAPALYDKRRDKDESNSVVRDTDNMTTSSQLVMDLTKKVTRLYLLPGKVAWEGVENQLPEGYKPKLSIEIFKYNRGKVVREKTSGLLPIMDPAFNVREMCKQLALLEDHLFHPRKRCPDCIIKHLLTVEALAEEAITLDRNRDHEALLAGIPEKVREFFRAVQAGQDSNTIAQMARQLRKTMMPLAFSVKVASTVKEVHLYDFDATLFRSPMKPKWWPLPSWWSNPISLSPPCTTDRIGPEWWASSVVSQAKKSLGRSDVYTAILTGRDQKVRRRVEELLRDKGLRFDDVFMKPGGDTESFKKNILTKLVKQFPGAAIHFWEDRHDHLAAFMRHIEAQGGVGVPHPVPARYGDIQCSPEDFAKTAKENIPGGRAKGRSPSEFDAKELEMGIQVEAEHLEGGGYSKSEMEDQAREIAMDHLAEISDYYTRLKKMEGEAGVKEAKSKYKNKKQVDKADGSGKTTVYEYSKGQVEHRNREKAKRVEGLRKNIDKLRKQVRKDVASNDLKTQLSALAVALIDETYERVGNPQSAKEGHFGVTGWQMQHITFKGNKATIKYVGKSGVSQDKTVASGWVVDALKNCCKGKGKTDQVLCDTEGECNLKASDVNAYLKSFDITAKDLRGYHANEEMRTQLKKVRSGVLPSDQKERAAKLKEEFKTALEATAATVGHEASTLKGQYLVPGLEDAYLKDGVVMDSLVREASAEFRSVLGQIGRQVSTLEWAFDQPSISLNLFQMPGNHYLKSGYTHDAGSGLVRLGARLPEGSWLEADLHTHTDNTPAIARRVQANLKLQEMWGPTLREATKTPAEKEDEEAERLVRPAPKLKPPRRDKRRNKPLTEEDADDKANKKDQSQNYKVVGTSDLTRLYDSLSSVGTVRDRLLLGSMDGGQN